MNAKKIFIDVLPLYLRKARTCTTETKQYTNTSLRVGEEDIFAERSTVSVFTVGNVVTKG